MVACAEHAHSLSKCKVPRFFDVLWWNLLITLHQPIFLAVHTCGQVVRAFWCANEFCVGIKPEIARSDGSLSNPLVWPLALAV